MTTSTHKVSIKFWQSINEGLFKVEYLNKFSQYFGNLAKAVMRSHNKKLLSKASKYWVGKIRYSISRSPSFMLCQNLIKTLYLLVVVYIS